MERAEVRRGGGRWALLPALLVGCVSAPRWEDDLRAALSAARRDGADLVVAFVPSGEGAEERSRLHRPVVREALRRGAFRAVACDAAAHPRLREQWLGTRADRGLVVLDGDGRPYAVRRAIGGPVELAAFLDFCAARRDELAALRRATASPLSTTADALRLGRLSLELGNFAAAEPLLLDAALAGEPDARQAVARLYALEGLPQKARPWLRHARATPAAAVTRGLLLGVEDRAAEAIGVLDSALGQGDLGEDRPRAMWLLANSLRQVGRHERADALLHRLAEEEEGPFSAAATEVLSARSPRPSERSR